MAAMFCGAFRDVCFSFLCESGHFLGRGGVFCDASIVCRDHVWAFCCQGWLLPTMLIDNPMGPRAPRVKLPRGQNPLGYSRPRLQSMGCAPRRSSVAGRAGVQSQSRGGGTCCNEITEALKLFKKRVGRCELLNYTETDEP